MWLLDVKSRNLIEFEDEPKIYGRYAILSHVWEDEEVTFQEIRNGSAISKRGYAKIDSACKQALAEKLDYCWIDTCCIDKTSSAELSQAINSMYRWYYEAKVCYAYLYDVPDINFASSKWFTRGWTLQELIAPGYLEFYDGAWGRIGTKLEKLSELSAITSIDVEVLKDRTKLQTKSVASRMAWAAGRQTARIEDVAYSLMGIFDVNMPMIYGEGPKAFARLQEEIIKTYEDPSIFAWQAWEQSQASMLLSPSPFGFRNAHDILSWSFDWLDDSFSLHNKGLRIRLPAIESQEDPMLLTAILNCRFSSSNMRQIAILLRRHPPGMTVPRRELTNVVCEMAPVRNSEGTFTAFKNLDRKHLPGAKWLDLMILKFPSNPDNSAPAHLWTQKIKVHNSVNQLHLLHDEVYPSEAWDPHECCMTLMITGSHESDRGYIVLADPDSGKKRFNLIFGQEIHHSGRAEPRIWLSKYSALPDTRAIYSALGQERPQQSARIKFDKGVLELVAKVDRVLTVDGDAEWRVHLQLEHYSMNGLINKAKSFGHAGVKGGAERDKEKIFKSSTWKSVF
ncbi:hypothetical protein AC578_9467 [Pseudocercospora eumusae]|uniref:Uncharacterized protein n=1 Tax=Pseudocercospora eumusae TaxID=321146 RepID=A0A139GUF4_9PEZI|nr:hypothetical protein AC578_9467 [Pseudocercospora eumusae]